MKRIPILLAYILVLSNFLSAQNAPLIPVKTDQEIVIDGILDDKAWEEALSVTGFKTFTPDYGKDMEQKTIVYMLYDAENLYFAYRCYDDAPDKIKASISARDNIVADDWVCINLDSFNDQQALYAFYVNPNGIQMDSRFSGGVEDASVDFVWYSSALIDNEGYSVEIQIPLKSIRFSNSDPVEMSVFFERKISRKSVQGSFPAMDPSKGQAFLTQMTPLVYTGVTHYKLFELLPALTYTHSDQREEGLMLKDERRPSVSLTGKFGITSQLILDATINPDFSQIEADAGQVDVNLRYKLFYPETRSFFLEGSENFNFAATRADEYDPVLSILHTRAIVNPLTGVKLSGKISPELTIATLYALDREKQGGDAATTGYAHYPVLRMKYKIGGDGYFGAIYTGRETDTTFNRVGGVDGQIRLGNGSTFEYNALVSSTMAGASSEITCGFMASAEYSYDTRDITLSFGGKSIGRNFYVEPGFISRDGVNYFKGLVKPKLYPESDFFRRIDIELFSRQMVNTEYNMWETIDHLATWIYLPGATMIKIKGSYSTEIFAGERFKTGGVHALFMTQFNKRLSFSTLYRRTAGIYYQELIQGKGNRLTVVLNYKPTENLHLDMQLSYADLYDSSTDELKYKYSISRGKITYQMNRYFFLRGVAEYNGYYKSMLTDFLASFTYIPGTVLYLGYGSVSERVEWDGAQYIPDDKFLELRRGLFIKCSYLYRF